MGSESSSRSNITRGAEVDDEMKTKQRRPREEQEQDNHTDGSCNGGQIAVTRCP